MSPTCPATVKEEQEHFLTRSRLRRAARPGRGRVPAARPLPRGSPAPPPLAEGSKGSCWRRSKARKPQPANTQRLVRFSSFQRRADPRSLGTGTRYQPLQGAEEGGGRPAGLSPGPETARR